MAKFINRIFERGALITGSIIPHPMSSARYLKIILLVAFVLILPAKARGATPPPPERPVRITQAEDGGAANNVSGWPAISADGRYIAFASLADNLVSGDINSTSDVFFFDHKTRQIKSVSLSTKGVSANGASYRPAISADGRFIAFTSLSTNLDPGDTNGLPDIYLRDLSGQTTIRISRPSDGSPANGWSDQASISADRRYVAFISSATNLVEGASMPARRVYVHDTQTGHVRLVSNPDVDSSYAVISSDGRYIVFLSRASDTPGVFLHDQLTRTTIPLPVTIASPMWQGSIKQVSISADGSQIALLVDGKRSSSIYLYSRLSNQVLKIADIELLTTSDPSSPRTALSADGRLVAYNSRNGLSIFDQVTGKTRELELISNTGPISTTSGQTVLSADGQVIAVQAGSSHFTDIYTLDLEIIKGRTSFISGWVSDNLGYPISGLEVSDGAGHTVKTDAGGSFRFENVIPRAYTINPVKEGVTINPTNRPVSVTLAGVAGLAFVAVPEKIVEEALKDIGMPYSLGRGCESPNQECGGPFHGFYRGDCTDLVIDAYAEGVDFDIQLALDRDFQTNPRHYYRWRDARNAHDMWRYFAYTNQLYSPDQPYLQGDIVFFDWELDGVVDHVAVVSEVNSKGRPRKIIDATGVTADNPSGLAAELEWKPYHAARTSGHTRWTGTHKSQSKYPDDTLPILNIALDSPNISLRVSDARGRAISEDRLEIPGGSLLNTGIGEVISIDQPLKTSEWYFIELSSPLDTPYQLGIQLIASGVVSDHYPLEGKLAAGKSVLIPVHLTLKDGDITINLPSYQP